MAVACPLTPTRLQPRGRARVPRLSSPIDGRSCWHYPPRDCTDTAPEWDARRSALRNGRTPMRVVAIAHMTMLGDGMPFSAAMNIDVSETPTGLMGWLMWRLTRTC